MSLMEVVRENPVNGFTNVRDNMSQDKSLTWGARGMLLYLLSLPPQWKTSRQRLTSVSPDGETKVRNYLSELTDKGYISRRNVGGVWIMSISDVAGTFKKCTGSEQPSGALGRSNPVGIGSEASGCQQPNIERQSQEDTVKNKDTKSSSVGAIAPLVEFIQMWNLLESNGKVRGRIDHESPGAELLESYDHYGRLPSLKFVRVALADTKAVYEKISSSEYLASSKGKAWFSLPKLLSKQRRGTKDFIAIALMSGFYNGTRETTGTNGRSQGERGAGHGDAVRSPAARVRNRDYSGIVGEKV